MPLLQRPRSRIVLRPKSLAVVAVVVVLLAQASVADAVELRPAGGMGLTIWFMDVEVTSVSHAGVGLGISGRVMLRVGEHLRLQAGLMQGRFTEDDDTRVKRNFIMTSAEALHALSGGVYFCAGARVGAEHLDMIETEESLSHGRRVVNDVDRWSFAWEPFLTLGVLLARKYHLELETGMAFAYIDSRVHISYTLVLGVYFEMGGDRGSHGRRRTSRIGQAEGGDS